MTIKHIVLEGGGYMGVAALGALSELQKEDFYNIDNINTIYATSIGAFIGAILCFKIKWDVTLTYVKERPWHKIVTFNSHKVLESIFKKGIFDISFFQESLKNLLQSIDFTIEITLKELFDYSKIEFHIFVTELNTFNIVDFNYKTHPNMKVLDAIYMSCTVPFLFQPMWYENSFYIDGGLINNYPVNKCIEGGANIDDILGIQYDILTDEDKLDKKAHVMDYAFYLYKNFFRILRGRNAVPLKNEIIIPCDDVSLIECKNLLQSEELRIKYINDGAKATQLFLTYMKKK